MIEARALVSSMVAFQAATATDWNTCRGKGKQSVHEYISGSRFATQQWGKKFIPSFVCRFQCLLLIVGMKKRGVGFKVVH